LTNFRIADPGQTSSALPFADLIDELSIGFAQGCSGPARHHHTIENDGQPDATLLLMPAWSNRGDEKRYVGVKLVTIYPGNSQKGLAGLTSTYVLYDGDNGQLLAMLDGNVITARRTAATAALGARFLSREDSRALLLLGSGRVASLVPEAIRAVRPIEKVEVWDIDANSAGRLVGELNDLGFRADVVSDLRAAAGRADIVSAATLSTEPLLSGSWLRPGTHVHLIGSFTPAMREADDELIRTAELYVDTRDALHETGDLIQPIEAGVIGPERILGSLAELTRGTVAGRSSEDQITLFKAVGSSLADLVAARLVYRSL
jgi:ornithine cyclodeaminase